MQSTLTKTNASRVFPNKKIEQERTHQCQPSREKSAHYFDKGCVKESLDLAFYIVRSYSNFISKDSVGEFVISDEKNLPHPKKVIISAHKLWLQFIADRDRLDTCRVQFPLLAQYQENIGEISRNLFEESIGITEGTDAGTMALNSEVSLKVSTDIRLVQKVCAERDNLAKIIDNYAP